MARKRKGTKPKYATEELEDLIREATIDCYDDEEQVMGLAAMIEENLALPFETEVLGITITVKSVVNLRGREIVAMCHAGTHQQAISLADLPIPSPPPEGAEWIAAYRHWASLF